MRTKRPSRKQETTEPRIIDKEAFWLQREILLEAQHSVGPVKSEWWEKKTHQVESVCGSQRGTWKSLGAGGKRLGVRDENWNHWAVTQRTVSITKWVGGHPHVPMALWWRPHAVQCSPVGRYGTPREPMALEWVMNYTNRRAKPNTGRRSKGLVSVFSRPSLASMSC